MTIRPTEDLAVSAEVGRSLAAPVVALVLTIGSASCGGGGTSAACPSNAVRVAMEARTFVPYEATARVGQKICWVNESIYPHDVRATSGGDFKSPAFDRPETFTADVEKAGRIEYVCTIHPGMVGAIDVTR